MTRTRWTILAVVLVALLAVAILYRQSLVLRITSMRPFVEDRFDGWVRAGADEVELDAAFRRVLEYLKARPDLDGDRMAVYLQSFAGYYAVKLAVLDPNVKAAVNVGGRFTSPLPSTTPRRCTRA